jgi:N6-adenosine-specific RNA methylase IME4
MTLEDIAGLPVSDMADKDAHLYVWTVNRHLEATYGIIRGWGFRPSTTMVWCKAPMGLGMGGAFTLTTEYVILARRGNLKHVGKVDSSWWQWKRGPHSQKPDAFIDLVEQVSPGPYLEMFARRQRMGWDAWGDEVYCPPHLPEPVR